MVSARAFESLQVAIGQNMRRAREEYQRGSQDQGAALIRSFGLDWNRSQLAKAERGEASQEESHSTSMGVGSGLRQMRLGSCGTAS